ncbi:MAG: Fur family transcriptional regulator [Paracoccus sp. (in: a-proteobacteria)]|nr:Fur family transcriptional regulator [Paracoccus sp. (in: a-proteobacteria)]
MNGDDDIAADLRQRGVLVTRQRLAVLDVLRLATDHPTADEILSRARAQEADISQATVYRALAALEKAGAVLKNDFDGAGSRYEMASDLHHDHLVDLDSGEIIEFHSPEIEALQSQIAAKLGYDIEWHRLELYARKRPAGSG